MNNHTMEVYELYNLSISPLVTSSFSLKWSEDNHISLITPQGVHVFEFVPNPLCIYPSFKFSRSFIYPSEFMPTAVFEDFINTELWKLDREEIYMLLMQEAMTPKICEKTDIVPRIVSIAWSPIKLADPSKCLMAIVTSAGSVEILYKLGSNWLSIWNISAQWSKAIEEDSGIDPSNIKTKMLDNVSWKEHMKRFLGTAIAWSPLLHDCGTTPFAYLVSAYRSSEIVILRVEHIAKLDEIKETKIVHKFRLKTPVKINQLLWITLESSQRYIIMVGYTDGRIHGLRITESDNNLINETLFKYEDRPDRMPLTSIVYMGQEEKSIVILATKNSCLVALNLDIISGECLKKRYLRLEGFSITGTTVLSKGRVIVTTEDSRIYVVTIKGNGDLTYERVNHDMKTSKVRYLGTARSPNGTIHLNITSPDVLYDHLINREPSTLQIFTLNDEEWNPWRIIERQVEANIPLYKYWDCLETMRINSAKSLEPAKMLPSIPEPYDDLTIHKLRVVMWLTVIFRVLDKKQMLKGVDKIIGEISEAQPLIFLLSVCNHVERLAMKKQLSQDEKRSASFLRAYMEIYIAGEDENETKMSKISQRVAKTLKTSVHIDSIQTETCNLCGEILSELPWNIGTCPSGHKLPRCSLTLLQITSVRYRTCYVCGRIFHPSLDEEYEEIRCLYCDVPAQYDSRVASHDFDDIEKRFKNLSKRPISSMPEPKFGYMEGDNPNATPINERAKRRSGLNNAQTFAVIIDSNHDDDSLITETWQEF